MSVYAMNNTGPWYNERLKDKQDKEWSIFKKNELERCDLRSNKTQLGKRDSKMNNSQLN